MSATSNKLIAKTDIIFEAIVKDCNAIAVEAKKNGAVLNDINANKIYSEAYKQELSEKVNKGASDSIIATTTDITIQIDNLASLVNDLNAVTDLFDDNKLSGALIAISSINIKDNYKPAVNAICNQFKGDFASLNLLALTAKETEFKAIIYKYYLSDSDMNTHVTSIKDITGSIIDNAKQGKYQAVIIYLASLVKYLVTLSAYFNVGFGDLVKAQTDLTNMIELANEYEMRKALGLT